MQGERFSNTETKKSKAIRGGTRQARVNRIANQEAEKEIRNALRVDEYLKHVEDISDIGKEDTNV
jgi:hypothetical protein